MSDDESDREQCEGPRHFKILKLNWRSTELRHFLRLLDLLYLYVKFKANGRYQNGNWVRTRLPSNKSENRTAEVSEAVAGLPRNFYDTNWYENLNPRLRRILGATSSVDLTIPDVYKRYDNSQSSF